jgi:hypothetical protein
MLGRWGLEFTPTRRKKISKSISKESKSVFDKESAKQAWQYVSGIRKFDVIYKRVYIWYNCFKLQDWKRENTSLLHLHLMLSKIVEIHQDLCSHLYVLNGKIIDEILLSFNRLCIFYNHVYIFCVECSMSWEPNWVKFGHKREKLEINMKHWYCLKSHLIWCCTPWVVPTCKYN